MKTKHILYMIYILYETVGKTQTRPKGGNSNGKTAAGIPARAYLYVCVQGLPSHPLSPSRCQPPTHIPPPGKHIIIN